MQPCYEISDGKRKRDQSSFDDTLFMACSAAKRSKDTAREDSSSSSNKASSIESDIPESRSKKTITQKEVPRGKNPDVEEATASRHQMKPHQLSPSSRAFGGSNIAVAAGRILDVSHAAEMTDRRASILNSGDLLSHNFSSSLRQQQQQRLLDPMCFLQQMHPTAAVVGAAQRERILPSKETAALVALPGCIGGMPNPQQELILQELLARASFNRSNANDMRHATVTSTMGGSEVALRSEIEMLEQTRRNILVQQQRLQILLEQAQAASSTRHLVPLASAYDQNFVRGGLRGGFPHLDDLERRALELSAAASVGGGRVAAARLAGSSGGYDLLGGTSSSNAQVVAERVVSSAPESLAGHFADLNNNSNAGTAFHSLANMVGSSRLTMAQIDEIEEILQAQRAEKQSSLHGQAWRS